MQQVGYEFTVKLNSRKIFIYSCEWIWNRRNGAKIKSEHENVQVFPDSAKVDEEYS